MSSEKRAVLAAFLLTTLAGSALHFLYTFLPSPLTALFAPVSESIWEHGKLVFWPGLVAALVLSRTYGKLGARLAGVLVGFAALLGVGFLYNILLGGRREWVNILIYVGIMFLVFRLPEWLDRLGAERLTELFVLLIVALGAAIWLFTFLPPDQILYRDLSAPVSGVIPV